MYISMYIKEKVGKLFYKSYWWSTFPTNCGLNFAWLCQLLFENGKN